MIARLILIVLIGTLFLAGAAEKIAEEYNVKGAFLLNFAKFVEWPPEAFKGPGEPIAICVLGQSPFGSALDQAARDALVDGRRVTVRQVTDGQTASQCQIVFVSASERKRWRSLLEEMKGASVLTVGESESFISSGGIINFRLDGEKIRIEINAELAARAKLHISAKLLNLTRTGKR